MVKPFYVFGIDLIVQNRVGPESYGKYFAVFNLVLIFQILLDLGLENYTRKEIARQPSKLKPYFFNSLLLKCILGAIFFLVISIAGIISKDFDAYSWKLLIILMINQFLASMILFLRANLGGLQLFKTESFISVMDRILMIAMFGTILYSSVAPQEIEVIWLALAQGLAYFITCLIALSIVMLKAKPTTEKFSFKEFLPLLQGLAPFASLVLLMSIYYRIDPIIMSNLLEDGELQSGIYAYGFRILDFMSNYALLFPILLIPIFSKLIQKKETIKPLLKLSSIALIIPSLSFLVPAIAYRQEIFEFLNASNPNESSNVFAILSISFIGICVSYTYGALLTANGNLKELNRMALAAVCISFVLNLILVPRYKALGSAIANATAHIFTIGAHFIIAYKVFKLKIDHKLLLKTIIILIGIFAFSLALQSTTLQWMLGFFISGLLGLLLAWAAGLIKPKLLIQIVKEGS